MMAWWWKNQRFWLVMGLFSCICLFAAWEERQIALLLGKFSTAGTRKTHTSARADGRSSSLTQSLSSLSRSSSGFDAAASIAYNLAIEGQDKPSQRQPFNLSSWDHKTDGGLHDEDRKMLGKLYGQANSVFEFGLGESTYIANHVGVPRYSGVDSDAKWVSKVRAQVKSHYRFYFADIGETKAWGYPTEQNLQKSAYNYQVLSLAGEPQAFDVYMVDGRFRIGCLLMSFLHASSKQADAGAPTNATTTVLVHDCRRHRRKSYKLADHLLVKVGNSGQKLCAYQRKESTTDEQLLALWKQTFQILQ